jgi:hypothetical protein
MLGRTMGNIYDMKGEQAKLNCSAQRSQFSIARSGTLESLVSRFQAWHVGWSRGSVAFGFWNALLSLNCQSLYALFGSEEVGNLGHLPLLSAGVGRSNAMCSRVGFQLLGLFSSSFAASTEPSSPLSLGISHCLISDIRPVFHSAKRPFSPRLELLRVRIPYPPTTRPPMEGVAAASAIVGLAIPVFKSAKSLRDRIKLVRYLFTFHVPLERS